MAKVYLSPAYHSFNKCAVAGCDETTHNNLYLDELTPYLTACGIQWKRGPRRTPKSDEDGDALMIQAVKESDAFGADVHYISHTNAFNGTVRGCRPMIYPGSTEGKKLASCMIQERKKIYSQPITFSERDDLYELRVPKAASYYEEHVFHDNKDDAAWFHANLRSVAESAARGLCRYFGITFVDPYAKPVSNPDPKPEVKPDPKPEVKPTEKTYTVKAGDTLWSIAQQYGTTHQILADYNNIDDASLIRPGQVIKIPGSSSSGSSGSAEGKYTVKVGDTLWSIAQEQLGDGSRYTEIQKRNGLKDTLIRPGDVLVLPAK